jgi:hypothetical protein
VSRVGAEEPISIDPNGHLLYLLSLLPHVLHHKIQVMRELSPDSRFVTEQRMKRTLTHHPIVARSDAI